MSNQVALAAPVKCYWSDGSAPFYVTFVNQDSSDVKIRLCPKKYDKCTGDTTQPNSYVDCDADLGGLSTSAFAINTGVGYLVVYYKSTGKFYEVAPTVKGGLAWAGTVTVPAQ